MPVCRAPRSSGASPTSARLLELESMLERLPAELSGGQRQRVAIGRARVKDPKVFMFDEPLSNLDAALRTRMRQEIANLHRRLRSTMIFVTNPASEFVATFIGSPAMNLLPARVAPGGALLRWLES